MRHNKIATLITQNINIEHIQIGRAKININIKGINHLV